MSEATFVRNLPDYRGDARLYRLSDPLAVEPWDDEETESFEYVVVSAVVALFSGPETYIFGANEAGDVVNWLELPGSFRGDLDHVAALQGAGYEVVGGAR